LRSPISAASAEKSINFQIDHQCPQCGAPATFEETERLFTCPFCKVKSYLLSRGCFRYLFPRKSKSVQDLVYVPYWRFKGMLFSCLSKGVKHRFIDASHQAITSDLFPASVGLRSQALSLKFVTPEEPGLFLTPRQTLDDVTGLFEARFNARLTGPIYHQTHIGEAASQIYSPFYVGKKIIDAVLDEPLSRKLPPDFSLDKLEGGPPKPGFTFIPAICPHCGWDLNGSRDSLVLSCKNCVSMWFPVKNGLKKMKFAHLPGGNKEASVYLPFWRIKADVSGIQLKSYADVVRLANLPKVVQTAWESQEFRFWASAFKVVPQVFLRLGTSLTLSQPAGRLEPELPEAPVHPVTLPFTEGIETLKVSLAGFMKPRRDLLPALPDIQISPRSILLVYLPFQEGHHDLTNDALQLSLNKKQLSHAANL